MKTKFWFLIFLISILYACGAPKYGCPYGEGVTCKSLDRVFKDSLSGELEKKKEEQRTSRQLEQERMPRKLGNSEPLVSKDQKTGTNKQRQSVSFNPTLKSEKPDTVPLRTPPEILRVWIAPWEDTNGALHGGNYIYLVVNSGKWIIENTEIKEGENIIPLGNTNGNTTEKAPRRR